MSQSSHDYDVAVSFAGEDRHLVEPIVEELKRQGVQVFYDRHETAKMWGTNGQEYFTEIFSERARFCMMFVSQAYAEKMWTNAERQAAMARAMQQKTEYILPVRMDGTKLPGLLPTIQYLSYEQYGQKGIVEQFLAKLDLGKEGVSSSVQPAASSKAGAYMPRLKKEFSERERHVFARKGFEKIQQYFEGALKQLEAHDSEVETDFEPIHRAKFLCRVYVKGKLEGACKVWLGGLGGRGSDNDICYHEGTDVSRDQDNSYSNVLPVEDDGHQLGFGKGHNWRPMNTEQPALRTAEQVAEHLWQGFIKRLEA